MIVEFCRNVYYKHKVRLVYLGMLRVSIWRPKSHLVSRTHPLESMAFLLFTRVNAFVAKSLLVFTKKSYLIEMGCFYRSLVINVWVVRERQKI